MTSVNIEPDIKTFEEYNVLGCDSMQSAENLRFGGMPH
jgi:hypothetical protein